MLNNISIMRILYILFIFIIQAAIQNLRIVCLPYRKKKGYYTSYEYIHFTVDVIIIDYDHSKYNRKCIYHRNALVHSTIQNS